jgi:hypothetical protein
VKLSEVEYTEFDTFIRFGTQHSRTNQESNCNQKNQALKKKNSEMEVEALDFAIAVTYWPRCSSQMCVLLAFHLPRRRELNFSVVKSRTRSKGGLHTDEAAVYGMSFGAR